MSPPRFFGYHQRKDGTVLITRGCRTLNVVRGEQKVSELLAALTTSDAQNVLAHWAAADLGHRGGATP